MHKMDEHVFLRLFVIILVALVTVNVNAASFVDIKQYSSDNQTRDDLNGDWLFNKNILIDTADIPFVDNDPEEFGESLARRMKSYMDMLADPCEDFYQYACGNWPKIHPIREEHFEYNVFSVLQENLYTSLRELLLESPSKEFDSGNDNEASADDKAKYFYASCINDEAREKLGEKPLMGFLKQFGNWPAVDSEWKSESFDWIGLSGQLAKYAPNSLIRTSVGGDLKESEKNIIYIDEPELTLSRRDIYLGESNSTYMIAYHQLIKEVVQLLGFDEAIANNTANEIIEFEKLLAAIKTDPEDRMELENLYNKITIENLISQYPQTDWLKYLSIIYGPNMNESTNIILLSKDYMKHLPDLLAITENVTTYNYILWRYVKPLVEDLDERFKKVGMNFSKVLTGQEDEQSRAISCVHNTNLMMGMALGSMFVRRYFDNSSKADVMQLTREIQQSFRDALRENNWIDQSTKILAEEKANKIVLAVGYPTDILSPQKLNDRYKGLVIDPNSYFRNSLNLGLFHTNQSLSQLNKPVDREEWAGYPAVINAYFEQSNNRIIIPAGVLQPPVYCKKFPRALNYAGIGNFVGHELTHGFDDTGRNFDLIGNMKQWWTNNSIDAFKVQGKCFEDQYNKYSLHGKNVNGLITKGENIADNGGLQQAFRAYDKWLKANPNELQNEKVPGLNLTDRKLFFLGFAQTWCGSIRPEAIDNKLETDAHSPGKYRVLGTLRNFQEFSNEFQCGKDSSMNSEPKCKLW